MVSVDVSHCGRCGGVIPPSAPLGLCKSCFRTTTGLSEAEWDRRSSLGLPQLSQESTLPEPSVFEAGQKFGSGRYVLERRLGQGGMGDVWLAKDLQLAKPVALKFLAERIRLDPRALKLLRDEVVLCQELSHPNVLRIYDWKEHADEPVFVTMEYVDGGTLEEHLGEQPGGYFRWIALAPYAKQLCDGLKYAHDRKVIHRDIKPRNLLITRRNVLKLADFGLARVTAAESVGSSERTSGAGTLAYMSPQQRAGELATVADDIYAVGATLYELLTGAPPPSPPPRQPVRQATWPKAPLVREAVGQRGVCDVPKPVQEAIAACLEYERGRRPRNVYQLAQRMGLEQSDWGDAPGAEPREPKHTSKWLSRIKIAAFIGVSCAVIALVGPRVMERFWTKPKEPLLTSETKPPPARIETPPPSPPAVNPRVESPTMPLLPIIISAVVTQKVVVNNPPLPPPPTAVVAAVTAVTNVATPPTNRTEFTERKVRAGDPLVLQAEVTGTAPLEFQWLKDGKPLPAATTSRLTLLASLEDAQADYALVARNAGGAVTTKVARITVVPALPQAGQRWTNSLGMAFLPLNPTALLAYSETRVQDFNAYRAAAHLRTNAPSFPQGTDHPVVCVSWKEAAAFCRWLTARERESGQLGGNQLYRLPLRSEWLAAALPMTRQTEPLYAWGTEWPPPGGLGNLPGGGTRRGTRAESGERSQAQDRFEYTSPVGSFQRNEQGFVDLVGNVAEWLGDKLSGNLRPMIGGAWDSATKRDFLLANPPGISEEKSLDNLGFRCVLDAGTQVDDTQH